MTQDEIKAAAERTYATGVRPGAHSFDGPGACITVAAALDAGPFDVGAPCIVDRLASRLGVSVAWVWGCISGWDYAASEQEPTPDFLAGKDFGFRCRNEILLRAA